MIGRLAVTMSPGAWPAERMLACEVLGQATRYTGMIDADSPYAVDLPEGTYVVRAAMPTGALMSSVAQVTAGEETEVVLGADLPASRGTGWAWAEEAAEAPTAGAEWEEADGGGPPTSGLEEVFRPDLGEPPVAPPVPLPRPPGPPLTALPEPLAPPPPPPSRRPTRPLFARLWLGSLTASWNGNVEVDPTGAVVVGLYEGPGPYSIQVGGPDVAWRTVRLPPSYGAQLTVARSDDETGFDDGVHVSVTGTSRLAASMFGYLATGQLDAAQVAAPDLVDGAKRLFQEKMSSPEGAAAAGYFLLRAGEQETVGDWPANFANWFGWLPDASIIHAWQLLRRPGVPERDLARSRLLDAARAGVPIYTEGLRLLFQGLQLFAAEDDADAEIGSALADIRAYAAACDWDVVHTTYWAARPDAPSLERHTGWPADPEGWVVLPTAE